MEKLMSQSVNPGRFTADPAGGPVTVFLIGMRANRWWRFGKVARVGAAIGRLEVSGLAVQDEHGRWRPR